jgi:phage terminase Nu1 subunit (DNA packaging protein)
MPNVLSDVDVLCTSARLAEICGVSSRTIDALVLEKVLKPVRSKLRGRHFRLSESVQRFVAYQKQSVRAQFASGNGAYERERTRRMSALATIEEARAKQISGELIEVAQVTAVVSTLISTTKSHLLSIPSRAMHELLGKTDPLETNQIVRKHVITALRELSQFDTAEIVRSSRREVARKNGAADVDDE